MDGLALLRALRILLLSWSIFCASLFTLSICNVFGRWLFECTLWWPTASYEPCSMLFSCFRIRTFSNLILFSFSVKSKFILSAKIDRLSPRPLTYFFVLGCSEQWVHDCLVLRERRLAHKHFLALIVCSVARFLGNVHLAPLSFPELRRTPIAAATVNWWVKISATVLIKPVPQQPFATIIVFDRWFLRAISRNKGGNIFVKPFILRVQHRLPHCRSHLLCVPRSFLSITVISQKAGLRQIQLDHAFKLGLVSCHRWTCWIICQLYPYWIARLRLRRTKRRHLKGLFIIQHGRQIISTELKIIVLIIYSFLEHVPVLRLNRQVPAILVVLQFQWLLNRWLADERWVFRSRQVVSRNRLVYLIDVRWAQFSQFLWCLQVTVLLIRSVERVPHFLANLGEFLLVMLIFPKGKQV